LDHWARYVLGFSALQRLIINGRDCGVAELVLESRAEDAEELNAMETLMRRFRLSAGDEEEQQKIVDFLVPSLKKRCVEVRVSREMRLLWRTLWGFNSLR
jgi:hypothetical protein